MSTYCMPKIFHLVCVYMGCAREAQSSVHSGKHSVQTFERTVNTTESKIIKRNGHRRANDGTVSTTSKLEAWPKRKCAYVFYCYDYRTPLLSQHVKMYELQLPFLFPVQLIVFVSRHKTYSPEHCENQESWYFKFRYLFWHCSCIMPDVTDDECEMTAQLGQLICSAVMLSWRRLPWTHHSSPSYYRCCLVLLSTLNILYYGRPLNLVAAAFLFTLEMAWVCNSMILPNIVILMSLNLTFHFPLAIHSLKHSFVVACPPPQQEWTFFEAVSALYKIFHSSLTTLQWPLLPVNKFTVISDIQLSFIRYFPSQLQLRPIDFYSTSANLELC